MKRRQKIKTALIGAVLIIVGFESPQVSAGGGYYL
jgi:hypothetical protein